MGHRGIELGEIWAAGTKWGSICIEVVLQATVPEGLSEEERMFWR